MRSREGTRRKSSRHRGRDRGDAAGDHMRGTEQSGLHRGVGSRSGALVRVGRAARAASTSSADPSMRELIVTLHAVPFGSCSQFGSIATCTDRASSRARSAHQASRRECERCSRSQELATVLVGDDQPVRDLLEVVGDRETTRPGRDRRSIARPLHRRTASSGLAREPWADGEASRRRWAVASPRARSGSPSACTASPGSVSER